ncbi:MAG: hypothetical protein AAB453_01320 [Patescibacteria group bacterium]
MTNDFLTKVIAPINQILGLVLPIIITLAILGFVWGLAKYIYSAGEESSKQEGRDIMYWGVIALFVMVSVWGLVELITKTFSIEPNRQAPTSSDIDKLIPTPK